jgi:uncharacterized membrane protein YtjA (UPF0391 family)
LFSQGLNALWHQYGAVSRDTDVADCSHPKQGKANMLGYAIVFLIAAIIAGILGFGVIAGTAALIAKILFVIFLILFIVSLFRRRGY